MNSVNYFTRDEPNRADQPPALGTGPVPRLAIAIVLFLMGAATRAPAQLDTAPTGNSAPAGIFAYDLGPENGIPVWNFSGPYKFPFYSTLRLQHYANGWVGTFSWNETNLCPGTAVLKGTVTTTASHPVLRLRSRVAVPFPDPYPNWDLRENWRRKDLFTVAFDSGAGNLSGIDYVTHFWDQLRVASKSGGKKDFYVPLNFSWNFNWYWKRETQVATGSVPVTLDVPATTDGRWTLVLDLASVASRVTGTASIRFANGEMFALSAAGTYFPKTDKTRLVLKGTGTAQGAYLTVQLGGPLWDLESLRGRIAGQPVRFPSS